MDSEQQPKPKTKKPDSEDSKGSLSINLGVMKLHLSGKSVSQLTPWIGALILVMGISAAVCAVIAAWGNVTK